MKDISVPVGEHIFNFRVAGILISEDHILLNKLTNENYYFLPGGRVQSGEEAKDSLQREILEELNRQVKVEKLLFCIENFFQDDEENFHEICFYFFVSGIQKKDMLNCLEDSLEVLWVPLKDLASYDIKPSILKDHLPYIGESIHYPLFLTENDFKIKDSYLSN